LNKVELKVYEFAKNKRQTSAGQVKESLKINISDSCKVLKTLCSKGFLRKSYQAPGKSETNFKCERIN
jgi:predicted transcriptional regulator